MKDIETYESVWDALSDTPGEAANLKAKSELMHKLINIINQKKSTQAIAVSFSMLKGPSISS